MDDIYGDLENFNDVNLVNELKAENAELKQKLEECRSSKKELRKRFDKLSSDFKIITENYSSLMKVAKAEIKRKSDMITTLNTEKDALVIKHFNAGRGRKRNNPNTPAGRNQANEVNRKECKGPPSETSSTDLSHKLTIVENRLVDNLNPLGKNASKANEAQKYDAFPSRPPSTDYRDDRAPGACGVDRRLSMLAGQQFAKFSSDEEFEDMYSALEPKTKTSSFERDEPERSRKRNRDDPQSWRAYDSFAPLSRYASNPESSRDRIDKNRNSRYHDNDKNRDKYDYPPQSHRNKISPDRPRRSRNEYGEDRYSQRYDRPRRLETPPERARYQHKSRERRPYLEKERADYQNDMHRYNSSDRHTVKPNIHGDYDEPQIKRPRVETYPNPEEDRRPNDKFSHNHPSTHMLDGSSCQSPDYMHTEHAALNEPIREIKNIAVSELDDPRVTSRKYLKRTDGTKDIICSVSSNQIDLQPVNISHWNLEKIPEALARKPVEISEELVTSEICMDIDKPKADSAAEATDFKEAENNREVTECVLEKDIEGNNKISYCTSNENVKDKLVSKLSKGKSKEGEKLNKTGKCKISKNKLKGVNNQNGVVNSEIVSKKSEEVDTNKGNSENLGALSFFNKLSLGSECSPNAEVVTTTGSTKSTDTLITEHVKSCKNESETRVLVQREFEHKVYSIRHIVEGDLELSDETNDDTHLQARINEQADTYRKNKTKQKSKKDTSKEKDLDLHTNNRKTRPKKDKVKDKPTSKFCELFGDSSSLITPEDLELATTQVHAAARAEIYVPVCEDAQDGIHNKEKQMELLSQTPQNEIVKSDESNVPNANGIFPESSSSEKKNLTEATKAKVTKHENTSYRSAIDSGQLVPNNSNQKIDNEIYKIISENTSCESSEKILNTYVKKPRDNEKTSNLVKKVKNTQDETTSMFVKKTQNDEKLCKSVKNTHDDEKSGKSVKSTKHVEKIKSVKKMQDDEKVTKSVNKTQDYEKENKSVTKTHDEKINISDNKTHNSEKASKSDNKTQDEKTSTSDKKIHNNGKTSKSDKKSQDEKTSKLVKKTQNDENTRKHTKKTRNDKITIDTDSSNKEFKTSEENVVSVNEENVIPTNVENIICANEENVIAANEIVTETKITRNRSISESKKHIHTNCNKENTAVTDIKDVNNEIPKIYDETLVPSKIDIDSYKVNDEKVIRNTKPKEGICVPRIEEIPNLAPVTDDPGVQIVVISSGIQPSDSNLLQLNTKLCYSTPLKALATSTPAKEVPVHKCFSEIKLNGHQPESVNVKPPSEDSSPQCEADVPDVRINFYRRRKKVLKAPVNASL